MIRSLNKRGTFTQEYYKKQYKKRLWRQRGENPILHSAWIRKLRCLLGESKNFLEVGCGEGYLLKRAQHVFNAVGFDISTYGTIHARRAGCANVVQASALNIPFSSNSFDILVALDVIEHLYEPGIFLCEAYRVLKPAGILALSTPNPHSWGARRKGIYWFGLQDSTHFSIMPIKEWRKLIISVGFNIIEDGTDTLWDIPYFHYIPSFIQQIIFIFIKHVMNMVDVVFSWAQGENYICIARK